MKAEPLASIAFGEIHTHRYFVADLHLDGNDAPQALKFRALLEHLAQASATGPVELYLLGDVFNFWYEYRRAFFETYRADLDVALERAWQAGLKIFVISGNKDFGYGEYARKRFGATVLGDGEAVTPNDSRRVLDRTRRFVLHGRQSVPAFSEISCAVGRCVLAFGFCHGRWRNGSWSARREKQRAHKHKKPPEMLAIYPDAARKRLEEKTAAC